MFWLQAPVVRKVDNAIHWINHYPVDSVACVQAVTVGSIAENPFLSLIGRHLGFLRRALWGTSGRAQKSSAKVNYRSPRSSASRIIQNGSHEKASTRFSRRRNTPTPPGRLLISIFFSVGLGEGKVSIFTCHTLPSSLQGYYSLYFAIFPIFSSHPLSS